jgi:hypothetical protein
MLKQILFGSAIIAMSIFIHVGFISAAIGVLRRQRKRLTNAAGLPRIAPTLVLATFWLLAAHTTSIWLWSFAFLALGVFEALEPAVYFSLVSFTTLGFGDITLTQDWRILSGMTAVNGLLMFGFSTAFLFEIFAKMRAAAVG